MNRSPYWPQSALKPLTLAVLLALPGVVLADETAAPAASETSAEDAPKLKTVVVTARRREEAAQDVPTPITTLSGANLETQKVYRIQDLQQALPSVNVAYVHARVSSLAVRGIGNNPASDGLEGSAGVYLDNVYLGRPGMAAFDLLDIEQLELLRGPQGTLFGKNTTAGVLNITTRGPTFTPESTFEVSGGERGYFQTKGSVSGPLTDTLAGRLSFYRTRDDGYLDNDYDNRKLLGGEREGLRGQLLFKPNDDFSLRWINEYNEENSSSGSSVVYGAGKTFWDRATLVGANPKIGRSNIDGRQNVSVHQNASSVEANWNLNGGYTLTSISAYRYWHFNPANDADQTEKNVIKDFGYEVHDRQFSQEIRLASPKGETVDYVVGAYAFKQDLGNRIFTDLGPLADLNLIGANLNALNNIYTESHGKVDTESYALFGQATWHLTNRLDFTAGIRGTYEEKTASIERLAPVGGGTALVIPGVVDGNAIRDAQVGAYDSGGLGLHSAAPSGLLSLSYRFTDDVLGYASLSHGEKSGGVNLAIASAPTLGADSLLVGPERANDAELGIKTQLFNDRLQFNTNIFWTQVDGYQATTYYQPPGSAVGYQLLTNAGTVRSRGVEFEASVLPVRGLTINANGSFNDVTYLDFKDAPCPAEAPGTSCNLSGERVAGASRWIGNLNAEYKFPLVDRFEPYVAGSYSYRSEAEGTLDNSDLAEIDGYALANFVTGVRVDYGDGLLDASLWVKNAFDKEYYLAVGTGSNGLYTASLGQPRTAGVTLRYDF
ncbi:TonB-dependent receptor [Pseudomonas turukhanskensis]|uniref:TonB-dependent receptor n=1 Tax=Pseudomonas turukhanskensis TaxID=1806536 RepID=A0A9W6K470_9PSED|nr:TonB-dependent receptor [Pseudomonas turukhanskensis]GLK87674.1 TonB-dependent receptor [Pseudomonas turukhanskensis]